MREPLLLPVCGLAAGIAAGRAAGFSWWDGPAAAIGLAALALLLRRREHARAAIWIFALAFMPLGGWLASIHRPGAPPSALLPDQEQTLTGCVVRPLSGPPDRRWFVLETEPGVRLRVSLSGGNRHPAAARVGYGRRLSFPARIREPRNFKNPGGFDYAAYLAARGIHWQATLAPKSTVDELDGRCGFAAAAFIFRLRERSLARLDELYAGRPYHRGMMKGLLVGDSSEIQRVWVEDFRRTGTYHALVISGSHISFVAGLFLLWWRFFRCGEFWVLLTAASVAWLYAVVASADPPVLRSAAGFSMFVAARFWYRRPRLMNVVAAVALVFLLFDPWQLFEASFQLSFLAVTAIAVLAVPVLKHSSGPLYAALNRLGRARHPVAGSEQVAHLANRLRTLVELLELSLPVSSPAARRLVVWPLRTAAFAWDLFVVSAAVQVALVLPMVFYFHRVSLSGLSANVFATPLITLAIPFGFGAVLFNWTWAAGAAGALLKVSEWIVALHARWEPAWRVPDPPVWLAVGFGAALILAAMALRHSGRWGWAAALGTAAALGAIVLHPFPPRLERGVLELAMIDVGQGESLFMGAPDGRTLLLDAGGLAVWGGGTPPRLDIGEDVVGPYLWSRGIRRLDVLVLSHLHQDHAGGAAAILEAFRPAELWTGEQEPSPEWDRLRAQAARLGVRIREYRQGDRFEWGGARFETLAPHPVPEYLSRRPNDDCLIFRVRYGRHSLLLTADAAPLTERLLLEDGLLERTDVLKVAHHGSRRSSRADFLDAVRPTFALISVGRDNPHGMPAGRVLEALGAHSAMVLRTDREGLIRLSTDGSRIAIETARERGGGLRMEPF